MDFSDWITNKYIQWPGDKRGNKNQTAYARWLKVPQQVVSDWMKKGGTIPHKAKYVNLLAVQYPEIYDVLDLPAPKNHDAFSALPPDFRYRLLQAEKEVNHVLRDRGLTGSDPEAEQITIATFERWGFKYTSTEIVPDDDSHPN